MIRDIRFSILFTFIAVLFVSATAKPNPVVSTINKIIGCSHSCASTFASLGFDEEFNDVEIEPLEYRSIYNILTSNNCKWRVSPSRRTPNGGNASRCGRDEWIRYNITTHLDYCPYRVSATSQANMRYYIYLRNLRI